MIRFLVLSTLAAGLFYGLYCLTLRRDRWLKQSQWYLLTTLWFSVIFPWFTLPSRLATAAQTVLPTEGYMATLDEITISAYASMRTIDLADIHLIGVALSLGFLLFQIGAQAVTILRLWRKHTVYRAADGYNIPRNASLVLLDDDTAPYSFFNQIVVGTRGLSDAELRCILAHESLHVSRYHTADIICARLLCCGAWFNPFAWLMLRELRAVQEFQADAASIGSCGREGYLHLLYRQATGTGYGHITNNFLSINIKKRIVMMNKTKSRFGAWKALAALPVAAVLLMAGCQPANGEAVEQEEIPFEATNVDESAPLDANTDEVFKVVEVDPEFPGGEEALYKYLAENIKYPVMAKNNKVEGRVYITFVIEKDGTVSDAKVLRSDNEELNAEALRVINAMPKWKPGTQRGVPVRVQYNIPISFKLQ
ncbi:MAG: TonB family protein [Bacteroidales bacterium]|nr:TonB family protein [Bacteroidales bacterium]